MYVADLFKENAMRNLSTLFQGIEPHHFTLVATDMDGTLTQAGKFTPALLQALEDLAAANIKVLIVTGRSGGWVSGLVTYLPVAGAIAENGGLFYVNQSKPVVTLTSISDIAAHRQELAKVFTQLQLEFPNIRESADNRFRITDWTFDVQGLGLAQLQRLGLLCQRLDWGFTYSTCSAISNRCVRTRQLVCYKYCVNSSLSTTQSKF